MAYIMDTNDEERAKGKTVEVGAGIVHLFVGILALPLALSMTPDPEPDVNRGDTADFMLA